MMGVLVFNLLVISWFGAGVVLMLTSGAASALADREVAGEAKYMEGATEVKELVLWPVYLKRYYKELATRSSQAPDEVPSPNG